SRDSNLTCMQKWSFLQDSNRTIMKRHPTSYTLFPYTTLFRSGCRWLASNRPWDCRAYLAAQVASSNDGRTECDQCRHKAASRENKITGGRGGKRYGNGTASSRAKGHCGLVRRAGCDGARCAEGHGRA